MLKYSLITLLLCSLALVNISAKPIEPLQEVSKKTVYGKRSLPMDLEHRERRGMYWPAPEGDPAPIDADEVIEKTVYRSKRSLPMDLEPRQRRGVPWLTREVYPAPINADVESRQRRQIYILPTEGDFPLIYQD